MFGLGLSKYLHASIRPAVHEAVTRTHLAGVKVWEDLTARRRHHKSRDFKGKRVAVLGFIETRTGLGRGARLMHEQRRRNGFETAAFDVVPLLRGDMPAQRRAVQDALEAFAPTDVILHVNPPEFGDAVVQLPVSVFNRAAIIAYWAWELEQLPRAWAKSADMCDEIWTPSDFVMGAVRTSLPRYTRRIRVVGHPVDTDPVPAATPETRIASRTALGVAPSTFVVGTSFAMGSNFSRKNPLGAVAAFKAAFPDDPDVLLLIRCHDIDHFPPGMASLQAATAADPRIRVIDTSVSIFQFYHGLDAFLSMQRSEGFGLNLLEAAQANVDVVATAWSISEDIRRHERFHGVSSALVPVDDPQGVYSGIEGARWAEPDIADAAEKLRAVRSNRSALPDPRLGARG